MVFGFTRGDMPEAPPKDFANLPLPEGWSIRRFDSLPAMNDYARQQGVTTADAWNPKMIESAVVPGAKEVLLMKPGYFDADKEAAIERHEIGGHANGLEHAPDGKGWGWYAPDRTFYPVSTPDQLAQVQAAHATAPFDWNKAFAGNALMTPQAAPAQTAGNALTGPAQGLMGSTARNGF